MKNKQTPFLLFTIAIFLIIISSTLLSDGMFLDGVLYAAISNNLAQGIGSFWDLFLTNTLYSHFHEHPPLAFGIQSVFFMIFGESLYVERIYSLCTIIITAFIIARIWYKITDASYHKLVWLPLFFCISIPLITWSTSNNILENTMMIFTSLSVLFFIKSMTKKRVLNLVLSGLMLVLGVLTKGFVALFPLSLLLWVFLFKNKMDYKRFVLDTIILLSTLVLSFVLLFLFVPESYACLLAYFDKQIVGSIGKIQTVNYRFYIVWRLFNEILPMMILVFFIWLFSRKHKAINFKYDWFLIFLATGLSGVIPVMISMKQSGFYILASFPMFSIAFSLLIVPNLSYLLDKINIKSRGFKFFRLVSYFLILLSIVLNLFQINKIGRDANMLKDVYSVIQVVPKGSTITIQENLKTEWTLHGYFQRYGYISIDSDTSRLNKYILVNKMNADNYLSQFKKIDIELNNYDLYENEDRY